MGTKWSVLETYMTSAGACNSVRGQIRMFETFWVPMIQARFSLCEAPVGMPT